MSDAVIEFAKWVIEESVFQDYILDGYRVQEKAVELGLLEKTAYDPEKHGLPEFVEVREDWYEFSELLTRPAEQAVTEAFEEVAQWHEKNARQCREASEDLRLSDVDRARGASKPKPAFQTEREAYDFCRNLYKRTGGVTPELRRAFDFYQRNMNEDACGSCSSAHHFLRIQDDPDIPDAVCVEFLSGGSAAPLWIRMKHALKHLFWREELVYAEIFIDRAALKAAMEAGR